MTATAPDETATPVPGAVRKELYKIVRQDVPFELKAREALTLGKRYLDVENGHLTEIDQESSHWEAIVSADTTDGSFPPESGLDLGTTYCRETIKSERSIALWNASEQNWDTDPAFVEHGLSCYHGVRLVVDNEPYGTVCFVSQEPREQFNKDETLFVELMAGLLERELERTQHEAKLTRQTNLTNVLNRVLRHDLRKDMSVVRGFTQLMADELDDDSDTQIPLDTVDNLIDLYDKARDLEDIVLTDNERESTNITELTEEVAETITQSYPDVAVAIESDDDILAAVMPSFERALEELIENAAKHGGDPPTVVISVSSVANAVEIQIEDNGSGLADQEAQVLEEGTETPLIHGTGLGLWLTYWIVTSNGGSIDATSTDNGTTMAISIPRKPTGTLENELTTLKEARDKYQAAFEGANEAMVIANDDARIIDANSKAGQIYGMDAQELLGQPLARFFPDGFDFDAFWHKSHEEGIARDTMTLSGADGVERAVEFSAANEIIPGQTLIVSRDITERVER